MRLQLVYCISHLFIDFLPLKKNIVMTYDVNPNTYLSTRHTKFLKKPHASKQRVNPIRSRNLCFFPNASSFYNARISLFPYLRKSSNVQGPGFSLLLNSISRSLRSPNLIILSISVSFHSLFNMFFEIFTIITL